MDAWTRFAEALFRLNGLIIAAGENITAPLGQSSARWQVLGGLGYGPRTVADIARGIGHARQSVQRVADVLVGEGLVSRHDKPTDRRTMLLELTPAGVKLLGAIYERQLEWSQRVAAPFAPEHLEGLAASLREVADALDTDMQNDSAVRSQKGAG